MQRSGFVAGDESNVFPEPSFSEAGQIVGKPFRFIYLLRLNLAFQSLLLTQSASWGKFAKILLTSAWFIAYQK
jgi:hypothetical protein